jgi:hypothetical protein
MAHFVRLNNDNVVINVVVVRDVDLLDENGEESEDVGIVFLNSLIKSNTGERWIQTSYGSLANVHYNHSPEGNSPSGKPAFRKNYAGIGFTYDTFRDAFIPPKPPDDTNNPDRYVLDEDTCTWIDTLSKVINIGVTRS